MGQNRYTQIILVILAFVSVSILIQLQNAPQTSKKQTTLRSSVSNLKGWETRRFLELDQGIVESLKVDDYINQIFTNGDVAVSLYVGFYLTGQKVGAAHSPMVCYPGQGWVVSDAIKGSMLMANRTIHYTTMIVSRGQEKNLVFYWFQAFDKTCSGTFMQKIYLSMAKLLYSREDNAFVRISLSMDGRSREESLLQGQQFIKAFYPPFYEFVKE